MKLSINLASQPFRRDRPMIFASVVLSALLAVLLVVQVSLAIWDYNQSKETRAQLDKLESQLAAMRAQEAKLVAVRQQPENAVVLERSLFLNTLIYHKAISWTRILADLERILPYDVRLISIRPWLNSEHRVILDMNVGSEKPESLLKFLLRLEASELFGATTVSNRLPPSQNEPLHRYRINVNYSQVISSDSEESLDQQEADEKEKAKQTPTSEQAQPKALPVIPATPDPARKKMVEANSPGRPGAKS